MLDGRKVPAFGLGVYEMSGPQTRAAVAWALEAGYRHIDTAEWYENEAAVGDGVRDFLASSGVSRDDIFVTSKLMHNRGYDAALRDLRASLRRARLDYFDLYLLHAPSGGSAMRAELWRAMLDAKKAGLIKSAGVSNFSREATKHIEEIVARGDELPVVNQIDLHPFQRHLEYVESCRKHGILLEAWAPLARAMRFEHPVIETVAEKYSKTPAQIHLRWGLQHGFIVIPKSASRNRIIENSRVFDFELSADDMEQLDALDENLVTDWDITKLD
ncbi:Aldo/keto reductase [Cutaneotrichosporon oleaginosum]|uniref:Aldo/keto reductase n=1 Tax=Cutaneotrichosporon oleaginosum TaxID=879819 RepID=A0A0J0XMP8_9TREE|nr:Aldo/keto reductase [Cutaneotrichosporon oleaginosum]KLT42353.1 Aldo/keto reductase [Cutaneotrichosporon oleaginosum]